MPVVAAQYYRSATATRSGSPYTGPCRSLFPFVRHGASPVAFLLRDVSHKASSGNNLTASTREVARLIVATCRRRHRSVPGHVRPLRPVLGLPGQGRRLGLLGRSVPCGCGPFLHLSRPFPRPEPTRLQLPNRRRRPLAGACGNRRASAKRRQSQADSPRWPRPTVRPRGCSVSSPRGRRPARRSTQQGTNRAGCFGAANP